MLRSVTVLCAMISGAMPPPIVSSQCGCPTASRIRPMATVVGKIYDAKDNRPIEQAHVRLIAGGHVSASGERRDRDGMSGWDGATVFRGIHPGTYSVAVGKFRYETVVIDSVKVDEAGLAMFTANLVRERDLGGKIKGIVLHGDCDEPIRNGHVRLNQRLGGADIEKDGTFVIDEVPAGEYLLSFGGPGHFTPGADTVTVIKGETSDVSIRVSCTLQKETRDVTGEQLDWCPLHNEKMERMLMPMGFGVRFWSGSFELVKARLFPYCEAEISGGCGPSTAMIWNYSCRSCVSARRAWVTAEFDSTLASSTNKDDWCRQWVGDAFTIEAPDIHSFAGESTGCAKEGTASCDSFEVEFTYGIHPFIDIDYRHGTVGWTELIDGMGVRVVANKTIASEGWFLVAIFSAIPEDQHMLQVKVSFPGEHQRSAALGIIQSLRLADEVAIH